MTKKEMYEKGMEILTKNKDSFVTEESFDAFKVELEELLKPGRAGQSVNLDEITKKDENGNIVEVQCKLSGVWLPADTKHFLADKNSKIVNAEGEGIYPVSRQADKLKKEAKKAYAASKEAISQDVFDENITPAQGKEAIANLSTEPDYSSVQVIVESNEDDEVPLV